jgi:hypothetical protein
MFSRFFIFFASLSAKRQAHKSAISEIVSPSRPEQPGWASLLIDALTKPADKVGQDGLPN